MNPLFDKVTFKFDPAYTKGGTFIITARNNSPENIYIQSATLNGHPLNRCWLNYSEITDGGTLDLVMGAQPNKKLGRAIGLLLPSMHKMSRLMLVLFMVPWSVRADEPKPPEPSALLKYVNILQGVDSTRGLSHGNTLPLVGMPWGMTDWTIQDPKGVLASRGHGFGLSGHP